MKDARRSSTGGAAFGALSRLLTDTDRPIGERIHTADAILNHALRVGRQLRMQLTADDVRFLHDNPEALQEHREWHATGGSENAADPAPRDPAGG